MITRIIACVRVTLVCALFGYTKFCSRIASFHSSLIMCHLKLVAYKSGEDLEQEAQWKRQFGVKGAWLAGEGTGESPVEIIGGRKRYNQSQGFGGVGFQGLGG